MNKPTRFLSPDAPPLLHHICCTVILFISTVFPAATANTIYVATDGNDENVGTLESPMATLQTAISKAGPGDTVLLRGGTYRQTADISDKCGTAESPIRIVGMEGEKAILDGREPIHKPWTTYKGEIFQTSMNDNVEQLFVDDAVMTEARWPNASFEDRWNRTKWAKSAVGSEHGRMISPELGTSGVDWNGAFAVLNINHQWHTWIRPVLDYDKDTFSFFYDKNLPELDEAFSKRISWYWDDFFYLFGKLEALDTEEEWFYDAKGKILYFFPPSKELSKLNISYKKRDYGLRGRNARSVVIENLTFFGCTVDLQNCSFLTIDNCHFVFPSHSRFIRELDGTFSHHPDRTPGTKVHGDNNKFINSSLAYSSTYGLYMKGSGNLISNCVIHDINYYGPLVYRAIDLTDTGAHSMDKVFSGSNTVTRNTVYNTGGVAIEHRGATRNITYNHIFNGGLTSRDVSLIYTASPSYFKNTVAFNWVHGSTDIGIRGDNETYGQSIHHNIVWDCIEGIYEKGDRNGIYNNTCFSKKETMSLVLSMLPMRFSEWQKATWDFAAGDEGKVENQNTLCFNNVTNTLRNTTAPIPPSPPNILNNILLSDPGIVAEDLFVNFQEMDWRPKKGGKLAGTGITPENHNDFQGPTSDIGAISLEGEQWVPGADWLDCGGKPPGTLKEARALAIGKLGYDASEIWWKRDLDRLKELEREFLKKENINQRQE